MILLGNALLERLLLINVIFGMLFIMLGLAFMILAPRIARKKRGTSEVDPHDKIINNYKRIGLILILVGMVLMIIQ